jgi:hypothetical protein
MSQLAWQKMFTNIIHPVEVEIEVLVAAKVILRRLRIIFIF